jgi:uncharacterized cupin superfamily protein
MATKKLIIQDGKPHRVRRGKLVEIPAEWFGHVTYQQTVRKRKSKRTKKAKDRH